MFEEFQICPYTGLRSFTEEESLYFKGRDEHIQQATEQLQRNKFLMLTGASGDGKSSLVYAGIVPNARAGFLKSKYTQWCVADFRPERTPFKNLCKSIARQLEISNIGTVESELSHGFSALVDFYKNSIRYADPESVEWTSATEEKRAELKRRAANLIIIADQFEEFFTNPENYVHGNPSKQSNLVVNLLLETARIALEEGLPIYVVFTMRSDYIGQCAAFRGLPENIGFSQFFVPRLNRAELQDVIEEPATLSGNRISRRLTERLIHDITEGVDQLPILQHALSQIWAAADDGKEEMDLIHYAMVGGISTKELPDEDQDRFKTWFEGLTPNIKACYHRPGLQNVLDTHANRMYEMAADYYKEKTGKDISVQKAKRIIKNAFSCLTKIDQSRAVRNRMTLREIHQIMDDEGVSIETTGEILNIFREPGNTLVRPFISDEEGSQKIENDEVLDITHESLIRNWELLKAWADEEYRHYTTYLDFYQQVTRWLQNEKSGGFLLPIGTLTHFETWFFNLNPNAYRVNRYLKTGDESETLTTAEKVVANSHEFLSRSARKHRITRYIMKVGPRRIAAVFAVLTVIVLSSFYIHESYSRRNDVVMKTMRSEAASLLESPNSQLFWKTFYLISAERTDKGSIKTILNNLTSVHERVNLAVNVGYNLVGYDWNGEIYLGKEMILYADSVLNEMRKDPSAYKMKNLLTILIQFSDFADYYDHFRDEDISGMMANQNRFLAETVLKILKDGHVPDWNMKELNEGIEASLNHRSFTTDEIDEIIMLMSPFEGSQSKYVSELYSNEKTLRVGEVQAMISANGLYQVLAYLYASSGKGEKAWRCVQQLFRDHPTYATYRPDAFTIAGYFALYNHWAEFNNYAGRLSQQLKIPVQEVYQRVLERVRIVDVGIYTRFAGTSVGNPNGQNIWSNPLLAYLPFSTMDTLFEEFYKELEKLGDRDVRNYELASFYKLKGSKVARINMEKGHKGWESEVNSLFDKSVGYFQLVSPAYRQAPVQTFLYQPEVVPREQLYLYPDYREKNERRELRTVSARYHSPAFIKYLIDRNLFNDFYTDLKKLEPVNFWINNAFWGELVQNVEMKRIESEDLIKIESALGKHPLRDLIDLNNIHIMIINALYDEKKYDEIPEWSQKLDPSTFQNLFPEPGSGTFFLSIITMDRLAVTYRQLCEIGNFESAARMMGGIPKAENRVRLYADVASRFYLERKDSLADNFLDSAQAEMEKVKTIESDFWDLRKPLAYAIALKKGARARSEVTQLIRNTDGGVRLFTEAKVARAISFHDQFYEAYNSIPQYASSDNRLNFFGNILFIQALKNEQSATWETFDRGFFWIFDNVGFTL